MNVKETSVKTDRNYQLDFLKLVFAIMVFAAHTVYLTPNSFSESSIFVVLGYISVNFFFNISGMLMINSVSKGTLENQTANSANIGERSWTFVFHRIKGILMQYWVALALSLVTYIIAYREYLSVVVKSIPEVLMVQSSVNFWSSNGPTWYLAAMFIAMLPLSYLLIKNKDTYVNVIAPTLAVLLYGYLFASEPYATSTFNGVIMYSFIRAVCGLCSGALSWKISLWIKGSNNKPLTRGIATIAEIICYSLVFVSMFLYSSDSGMIYSMMCLLPVCIGITFSGASYISEIFKCRIFKYCAPLSLAIYLNHNAGKRLVMSFFPEWEFNEKLIGMIVFTIACMIVYYLVIRVIRNIYIYISAIKHSCNLKIYSKSSFLSAV